MKSDTGSLVLIVSFSEELYACEYIEGSLLTQQVYNGLTQVLEESVEALCLQKRATRTTTKLEKNGRAPEIDGLSIDFYEVFWENLGRACWQL